MVEIKSLTIPFEIKEQSEDSEFFTFVGIASSFGNIDHDNDRMDPGAFDGTIDKMLNEPGFKIPILWQHDRSMPIGIVSEIKKTNTGLWIKALLPKDDEFVRGRVVPQLKTRSINKMSVGFILKDWERDTKGVRDIMDLDLKEISLVTFPADERADVTEIKSVVGFQDLPIADRGVRWDQSSARRLVGSWAGSDLQSSSVQARYRRAFLWYDRERPDLRASYKMPIATIINGRLTVVPNAIFAAAARVNQAKIPSGDKTAIRNHLARYYSKMGMKTPFSDKAFRIDDFSVLSERSLENILMEGVSLSKKATRQLISGLKNVGWWDATEARRDGEKVDPEELIEVDTKLDEILRRMTNARSSRSHGKDERSSGPASACTHCNKSP